MEQTVNFPSGTVTYSHRDARASLADYGPANIVLITDEHIAEAQKTLFAGYKTIVLPAGEQSKTLAMVEYVARELLKLEATRYTVVVGVGGGVITDITGFVAAVYMRGIKCGFVPTSLLAMVDAAIGGKNGVNLGLHKNVTGTITQPAFIIYDPALLGTLTRKEWSNGFAEIIKYACLFDPALFEELAAHDLEYYMSDQAAIQRVIQTCVSWKNTVVASDEHEKGDRKLLNFGHTVAHAIENLYDLPHGQAVAIGMMIAAVLSEEVMGMKASVTYKLQKVLTQYELPVNYPIDVNKAMGILKSDKKRSGNTIDYILISDIGRSLIKPLAFDIIENAISRCALQ